MPGITDQKTIRKIKAVLDEYPDEQDAAPKLRSLAVEAGERRYKVFAAYRLLKQQEMAEK